ncbi:murein L,D-transpeptidase family protein [Cohaesibacter marisflavi]|uniref:murein L,D-transpeptidase family protein n=1 Tax=Cohaesibacter marisflavi TaxID=655353 RepID=UPI0029C8C2D9|nr:murein L,D-transpeptidase family protein [Cohaesibacter marisflavi]
MKKHHRHWVRNIALVTTLMGSLALSACNPELIEDGKASQPLPIKLKHEIQKIGSTEGAPLYIRIFKEEAVLEAWKQTKDGTYALLKSYPICAYSGKIGPKKKEGDRQAPEGFYTITPGQMNPHSSYYLSFNIGYPNKFDRSYGRTGKHLMVHGSCSSRGCYAMEDDQIAEIYALGRESFEGGQRSFAVHAFPFRMTPENMARVRNSDNFAFWQNLKNGYDHFQITHVPPKVEVCNRTYVFDPQGANHFNASAPCPDYTLEPTLLASLQKLRSQENVRFSQAVQKQDAADQKAETKANNQMLEAQLEVLQRKERIAEGKNPDGFLAGLLKGNPAPATAPAQPVATQSTQTSTAQAETPQTVTAQTQPNAGAPASNSFFSKLGSAISKPFKPLTGDSSQSTSKETATLTTLPQAR